MRRSRSGDGTTVLLPDSWSGPLSSGENGNEVKEMLLPGRGSNNEEAWVRAAIIARDPMAVMGIRHLLARNEPVWLSTYSEIPDQSALLSQDIIIWIRMHHDGMPELAGHVARLCRNKPKLKQLVVSDALPVTTPPGPGPLTGVWLARGNESREMLYALLHLVMRAPIPCGPMLTKRLGRMQWRVLLLRAAGTDTHSIASRCGIAVNTVSVHESALRERLGISGRSEYAWLLRSVAQMLIAVPALCRDIHRRKKNRNRREASE
ncbi:response regulator transcription factor [Cronobacter malonaticus]|jgi:DNA-binding CsgD family transcriptional regulator|nr:response regulator transcription factor [Cronobacter malonaticus]